MATIHRMNLTGRPLCGAERGNVSTTGVVVTCPACLKAMTPPSRDAVLESIRKAAQGRVAP